MEGGEREGGGGKLACLEWARIKEIAKDRVYSAKWPVFSLRSCEGAKTKEERTQGGRAGTLPSRSADFFLVFLFSGYVMCRL